MYSKAYGDKIKPRSTELLDEMMEKNGGVLPPGAKLVCHNRAAKELYDAETDEVKDEIKGMIEAAAKDKEEAGVDGTERTPEQYLQ